MSSASIGIVNRFMGREAVKFPTTENASLRVMIFLYEKNGQRDFEETTAGWVDFELERHFNLDELLVVLNEYDRKDILRTPETTWQVAGAIARIQGARINEGCPAAQGETRERRI